MGKQCNICGSDVEVVANAASQCSNNRCITRDRDNNLSTNSSAADVWEYHNTVVGLTQDELDEMVVETVKEYWAAEDQIDYLRHGLLFNTLLPDSSYEGLGHVVETELKGERQ